MSSLPPIGSGRGGTVTGGGRAAGAQGGSPGRSQRQKRDGKAVHIDEDSARQDAPLSANVLLDEGAASDRRVEWLVQQLHGGLLSDTVVSDDVQRRTATARLSSQRQSLLDTLGV